MTNHVIIRIPRISLSQIVSFTTNYKKEKKSHLIVKAIAVSRAEVCQERSAEIQMNQEN